MKTQTKVCATSACMVAQALAFDGFEQKVKSKHNEQT